MRKLLAAVTMALIAPVASPLLAADMPDYYPPIEIPEVDYGLGGSFYLRGSLAGNTLWSREQEYYCPPLGTSGCNPDGSVRTENAAENGFGYSFGGGFGYETGTGIRADITLDHLYNEGLANDRGQELHLRSTIALANVYYDFGFGGYGAAAGGFGAYVGAGIGGAYNWLESRGPYEGYDADGGSWSPAGALMTGVTYDMGAAVADLGYRMIYMPEMTNGTDGLGSAQGPYFIKDNFIHELRGTLRYRFN